MFISRQGEALSCTDSNKVFPLQRLCRSFLFFFLRLQGLWCWVQYTFMINLAHKLQVIVTRRKIKQVSCNSVHEYERKKRQIDREEWLIILIQREVRLHGVKVTIGFHLYIFMTFTLSTNPNDKIDNQNRAISCPSPLQYLIPSVPNYYNTCFLLDQIITIHDPFQTSPLHYLIPSGPNYYNT